MTEGFNVVFMGGFSYPRGMAGTKRIQNVITALGECPDVTARVILQRQSSEQNVLTGVHAGTPYETVMGDLFRVRMLMALPLLQHLTCAAFKRAYRPDCRNVVYYYGPLQIESVVPLNFARKLGYRIVFDIVEDFDLATGLSRSLFHRTRVGLANRLTSRIKDLAAGVVVISSHLEEKYRRMCGDRMPLHYMPISVDMGNFPGTPARTKSGTTLLYAGSFGRKDGVLVLLDAFDRLADRNEQVRLVLTGRGDSEAMKEFIDRGATSPHRERIDYRGYLEEKEYYSLLNEADILCMTRVDLAYAHAGFPFKLGEYLATGKPVIASRVSDVDRFLAHGQNAMLVQPGSSDEVCEAAEFLINNPEVAAVMGMQGRDVAVEHFDNRRHGRALRDFLECLWP